MQYHLVAAAAIALAGCGSYDTMSPASDTTATAAYSSAARHHHSGQEPRRELPLQELASAMSNAARYHDVRKALADGYRDTGIVLPNMGRHFLKESLLDARFEADRPELLVYTPDSTVLVALEYAVPIELSPAAPEGFSARRTSGAVRRVAGRCTRGMEGQPGRNLQSNQRASA
jgi:hypothetical protein